MRAALILHFTEVCAACAAIQGEDARKHDLVTDSDMRCLSWKKAAQASTALAVRAAHLLYCCSTLLASFRCSLRVLGWVALAGLGSDTSRLTSSVNLGFRYRKCQFA